MQVILLRDLVFLLHLTQRLATESVVLTVIFVGELVQAVELPMTEEVK